MTDRPITEADIEAGGRWTDDRANVAYNSYAATIEETQRRHREDFESRFGDYRRIRAEDYVEAQQALSEDPTIAHCIKKMVELKGMFWTPIIRVAAIEVIQ